MEFQRTFKRFYHEIHERRESFFTTKDTKGAKAFFTTKDTKGAKALNESSWVCKTKVSFNLIKAFKKERIFRVFSCVSWFKI
jgi:hypothetical protein